MALEVRGSRPYYYQKRRVDGRVVSTYLGSGDLARFVAALDAARRAEAAVVQAGEQAERERLDTLERQLRDYSQRVDLEVRRALERVGYHRHKAGPWRKRRRGSAPARDGPQ